MKKIIHQVLNAINLQLNHLVQKLGRTYEEQVLYEIRGKIRSKSGSSPVEFYNWIIHSHELGLIHSGIDFQFSKQVNDFYTDKSAPVVLDCGANIGMSVLRYKHLYPNAKIIAFEPDPMIFGYLKKNVVENELKNVELIQAAVWSEAGELEFSSDQHNGGFLSSQRHDNEGALKSSSIIRVPTIDLRNYLNQSVDFLKMDIEGAEYEVLIHCADLLHNVEKLVIEVHYRVDEVYVMIKILSILEDAGFQVSIVSPLEHDAKVIDLQEPFVRNPKSNADIYIGLYAWRST